MAHYARVDKITKEVLHVHVVNNADCIDPETGLESEAVGIAYLQNIHKNQAWIDEVEFVQTSYNSSIRKNYAAKGFKYDSDIDGFIPQKPYKNWELNASSGKWESPVAEPKDGKKYTWDEKTASWKESV